MNTTVMLAALLIMATVAYGRRVSRLQCPGDDVDRAVSVPSS